jgi:hypothetical protein
MYRLHRDHATGSDARLFLMTPGKIALQAHYLFDGL